ncbi:MAG: hypothetical protein WC911_01795 [Thermoleophilia bacterium]
MKAKYAGKCTCSAIVSVGFEIRMAQDDEGHWRITSCPACCDSLSRGCADTGAGMKDPQSNLQKRIERQRRRLAKR